MLKNLFKSKRQREMEREIAIQRALALHRNQIGKLEQQIGVARILAHFTEEELATAIRVKTPPTEST